MNNRHDASIDHAPRYLQQMQLIDSTRAEGENFNRINTCRATRCSALECYPLAI